MGKRKGEFLDENDLDSNESFSTKFNTHSFRSSWMIENYNSVAKTVKFIESPKFPSSPNAPGRQWFLEFEPKPILAESTESLEIILKKTSPGDVYVQASLFFKSFTSEKYFCGGYKKILPSGNFIFWKANISQLSKILRWTEESSNTLIVICDVRTVNSAMDVTRKIKNPHFENLETNNVMSDIYNILSQQLFTDVTFLIGEKKFHAHKTILAARSKIFAEMFFHENEEEKKDCSIVEVEEVETEVFEILLHFIYCGRVKNLNTFAQKIYIAAEKYGVETLKDICSRYIITNITEENIFDTIRFAFQKNVKVLEKKTVEFFSKNFLQLQNLPDYQKIIQIPGLVAMLLEIKRKIITQNQEEEEELFSSPVDETSFEFI